jgi:hypothetical protein
MTEGKKHQHGHDQQHASSHRAADATESRPKAGAGAEERADHAGHQRKAGHPSADQHHESPAGHDHAAGQEQHAES